MCEGELRLGMLMTNKLTLTGFGGVKLQGSVVGAEHDPAVLLVHGAAQSSLAWASVSQALVAAGRRVISLDLRGHGESEWPADGRYDYLAFVEDLRAVLAQLGTRPVVVSSAFGSLVAAGALAKDASTLAAGLIMLDLPTAFDPAQMALPSDPILLAGDGVDTSLWDSRWLQSFDPAGVPEQLASVAPAIGVPVLVISAAAQSADSAGAITDFLRHLPDAEFASVDATDRGAAETSGDALNALVLDFLERRQPRDAPEFRSGSDARTLRDAMGCFATGVTIVTTLGADGVPLGLTANSYTSVSLDPPLLLVCIANTSSSAAAMRVADRFTVNVLQIGQQPVSNRFASKLEDRFAPKDWAIGEFGAPVLDGSLCAFECEKHSITDAGDHFILVGKVLKASFEPRRDPLLYFRGKYRRLHFA